MIPEFYVVPGDIPTLLGCKMSEMLRVLKVGVNENNCELVLESARPLDKIAILNSKFPRVFEGLSKPNGYQLKVHQDYATTLALQSILHTTESDKQIGAIGGTGCY